MKTFTVLLLTIATSLCVTLSTARAHGIDSKSVAWGLGGAMAGSMFSDARRHHREQEARQGQALYVTPVRAVPAVSATPSAMTPKQKIEQLNKLAAGGYITPAEYKSEKQAVLNSIVE